ncbi:MAG: glycoside hydrolase family 30 protein [Bacillota bacterium]
MKKVKLIMSSDGSSRMLEEQDDVYFEKDTQTENNVINIYPEMRYQEIIGFGGAFTETTAYNYSKMSDEKKKLIIDAYFNKENGLGYNFCRTHIHSCDFSLERYTYVEENDKNLDTFSIDHDRRYIIPFIKAAQKEACGLYLFASPWSPPGWMKDNGDICHGGRLLDEYYDTWAKYFVKYISEYQKEGITFFGLTVQNEAKAWQTWESCQYTAEEEALFVHKYLKPALDKAGFGDLKIMIWDHNKERVYDRVRDSFKVEGAADDVWGIAFHWYSGDHFEALEMVHKAFPDKPLLLTEFCLGTSRGETMEGPHSSWRGVEIYASELIGNFNHYMAAAVDWNMVVDENGGPFHDREYGCKAMIVVNPETDTVIIEPTYYSMAHFSKFVKRGAVRIGNSSFSENIKTTAFQNPDGEIVVVVLNCMTEQSNVYLRLGDCTARLALPEKSLVTCVIPPEK